MDTMDKFFAALVATFGLVIFFALVTPKTPAEAAARDQAKSALPSGATLIYENDRNSRAKRVIQIGSCFFVEEWEDSYWALNVGDASTSAVQCAR